MQSPTQAPPSRHATLPVSIRIRQVDAADAPGLIDFYALLSDESRYRRFLGSCRGIESRAGRMLCTADHRHEEGIVAVLRTSGPDEGRIVGHVCLVRGDRDGVELGIAVADAWQGRGIGHALFAAALDWARGQGVSSVTAAAFASNTAVLHLLLGVPEGALLRQNPDGTVQVTIHLRSVAAKP